MKRATDWGFSDPDGHGDDSSTVPDRDARRLRRHARTRTQFHSPAVEAEEARTSPNRVPTESATPRRALPAPSETRRRLVHYSRQFVGETVGGFHFRHILGVGGMGCVFAAREIALCRDVAIKLLVETGAEVGDEWRRRFQREARAIATLEHPSVVRAYHSGIVDGLPYLAMELVRGASLREIIRFHVTAENGASGLSSARIARELWHLRTSEGPSRDHASHALPAEDSRAKPTARRILDAVTIGIDIAEALACAHDHGILHRDVKPSNILIDFSGRGRLTDFGLAQVSDAGDPLTQSGALFGTFRYMSPEQVSGKQVEARSDIYSLAASLYEFITLRPLCPSGEPLEVLRHVTHGRVIPPRDLVPEVPRALDAILLRATARRPGDRYATAREFAEDLRRFQRGLPVHAKHPSWYRSLREWADGHRVAATVLLMIALVVALMIGGLQWHNERLARLNKSLNNAVRRSQAAFQQVQQERQRSEDLLYASEIARAHDALARGNVAEAARLLAQWRDRSDVKDQAVEWRFLSQQLGKLNQSAPISEEDLYAIAISPRGDLMAAAGKDATIYLIDAELTRTVRAIKTGQVEINRLAFSRDGRRLLSAGDDATVRMWDVESGQEMASIVCGNERVMNVQFALDDRVIVTASNDAPSVKIWDAQTGSLIRILDDSLRGVEGLAVSPDGRRLAVAGWYSHTCWLYDLKTTDPPQIFATSDVQFLGITWSRYGDGEAIAASTVDGRVYFGPPGGPVLEMRPTSSALEDIALSANGRVLAVACHDGHIELHRLTADRTVNVAGLAGEPLVWSQALAGGRFAVATPTRVGICQADTAATSWTTTPQSALSPAGRPVLSPDGNFLYRAPTLYRNVSGSWQRHSWQPPRADAISAATWSRDSNQFIVGYTDGQIACYAMPRGELQLAIEPPVGVAAGTVKAIVTAPDQSLLAASYANRLLVVFDGRSGTVLAAPVRTANTNDALWLCSRTQTLLTNRPVTRWQWHDGDLRPVNSQAEIECDYFAPLCDDTSLAIAVYQNTCRLVHAKHAQLGELPLAWDPRSFLAVNTDGTVLSYTDWNGKLSYVNVPDTSTILDRSQQRVTHDHRTYAVAFSHSADSLYSAGNDGQVRVWPLEDPDPNPWQLDPQHVNLIDVARDQPLALIAHPSENFVLNLETGQRKQLTVFPDHPLRAPVRSAALTRDGAIAAVATEQDLYIWDARDGAVISYTELHPEPLHPSDSRLPSLVIHRATEQVGIIDFRDQRLLARIYSFHGKRRFAYSTDTPVRAAAWSQDLRHLAVSTDWQVQLINTETRRRVRQCEQAAVKQIAWAKHDAALVLIDGEEAIWHWDLHSPTSIPQRWGAADSGVRELEFASAGQTLLVPEANGRLSFWQTATGQQFYTHDFASGPITQVCVSQSGWMVCRNSDRIWMVRF